MEDGTGAVVERVEGGYIAVAPDPNGAGAEEISWELTRQLAVQIVSGQRKRGSKQIC